MTKFIPSIFTSINLLCGFIAILIGDFHDSSILLLCCIALDAMDGIAARVLDAATSMGKELDSLADLVSFGIAPAYLYFLISPFDNILGYIFPSLLVLGSALRLARFNIGPSTSSFYGLPTPATAFFFIGLYLSYYHESELVLSILGNHYLYAFLPIFFFIMMLSNLEMFSMKGMDKGIWTNKYQIVQMLIFTSLLFVDYKLAIPISVLTYILLSFIQKIAVEN